ncbi:MAG: AAA family ATPase [Armatimonadetes bacterium]|nr:AAA family ATPase [Armatimonadota bacterium]
MYIAEGEKDVHAIEKAGGVATCNPFGAGKWRPEFSEHLSGADVIVIADKDKAGWDHARDVVASLSGVAKSFEVRQAAVGEDAYDHLAAGHELDEFEPVDFSLSRPTYISGRESEKKGKLDPRPYTELLSLPEEAEEWLVDGLLLSSGVSMVAAKPKVGKSTLARYLALCVARGDAFLGRETVAGKVFYIALEEKLSQVMDHFRRMGATEEDENLFIHAGSAPDSLDELRHLLINDSWALVVIDPLVRLVRIKDMSAYAEVSNALDPLIDAARTSGAHILSVHHMGKRGEENGDGVLGSTALFGSVDTLINLFKRAGGMRVASTLQRAGTDLPETVLSMDEATGRISMGGEVELVRRDEAAVAIMSALEGRAMSETELREELEISNQVISASLRHLLDQGKLAREGRGRRNDPYIYSLQSENSGLFQEVV